VGDLSSAQRGIYKEFVERCDGDCYLLENRIEFNWIRKEGRNINESDSRVQCTDNG